MELQRQRELSLGRELWGAFIIYRITRIWDSSEKKKLWRWRRDFSDAIRNEKTLLTCSLSLPARPIACVSVALRSGIPDSFLCCLCLCSGPVQDDKLWQVFGIVYRKKKMGSKRAREGSFPRYINLLSCNISPAVVWIAAAVVNGRGKSRSSLEPPTSLAEIWMCSLVARLDTVAATQSSSLLLSLISSFTLFNLSFCISRASVWLTSATFKLRNNTTSRSEAAILCCWNRQIAHHLNYRYRSD